MPSERLLADPASLSVGELLSDARELFTEARAWRREIGASFSYVPTHVADRPVMTPDIAESFARMKLRQARERRRG